MDFEIAYTGLPGHEGRRGRFMHIFTGKHPYFPCDPRIEEIHIEDIAHHLSQQARFAGAGKEFVSVAEHCWLVSYILDADGSNDHALEKLMHDGAEAYLQDWIRPIKYQPEVNGFYTYLEVKNERLIAEKFGLQYPWPGSVKRADEIVCNMEMRDNIVAPNKGALHVEMAIPKNLRLFCWSPLQAEFMFLNRFRELVSEREAAQMRKGQ